MDAPQLTLIIREDAEQIGGVPAEALTTTIDRFRKLVDEVSEVVGEHYSVKTGTQLVLTDVQHGSAIFKFAAIPRTAHVTNISGHVAQAVGEGLAMLQRTEERPPYFSDRALAESSHLVSPLRHHIKQISVGVTHASAEGKTIYLDDVRLDRMVQVHVRALLAPRRVYLGSVEGRIYKLERKRKRAECTLYDRVRRQAITCWFPDNLIEAVRDAFDTRVMVSGRLFADQQGRLQRVEMQALRRLRTKEEQPSLESLLGSDPDFTEGVDAVTYVRAMRDEQSASGQDSPLRF